MKKILLGVLIGVVIATPIGAGAARYVESKYEMANTFIEVPYEPNTVSVFDDGPVKCYITRGGYRTGAEARTTSMSCVRMD